MRHRGVEVIAERVPARQDRLVLDPRLEQAQSGRLGDLQRRDGRIGEAVARAACRRLPTSNGRCRRNRGAAFWPAAWCRRAGWSERADIRPAHDRGSRSGRHRAAAVLAARDVHLRRSSRHCRWRARACRSFATCRAPTSVEHSLPRVQARSCRIWNGHALQGLVRPNGGALNRGCGNACTAAKRSSTIAIAGGGLRALSRSG